MKNGSERGRGLWLLIAILALLGGCAGNRNMPVPHDPASSGMIEDLRRLPQDLQAYVCPDGGEDLLSADRQADMNARFDKLYFGPWHAARVSVKPSEAFAIFGGAKGASMPRGWAEHLLPWTRQNWDRLVANAARESFPSRLDRGITVQATVLREAPTFRPRFGNPLKAGEGFPFDMFMYSSLPAGMPVLIVHTSTDGAWAYVETALVAGWVPAVDVAMTDAVFRRRFEEGEHAVVLQDGVPLRDGEGRFMCMGNVGTLLPLVALGKDSATLLVPARDTQGNAVPRLVTVPAASIARKPMPLTEEALARIGNGMLGQPYGWGGEFGNRDCSQMLRDLFIPFGVWLPRNSSAQARSWDFQNFSELSPAAKERMILERGKPFATLLWLPGHIALYLGEYGGKAVMFHNIWGLRTERQGREGRYIIGQAVVTSLRPGRELSHVQNRDGLVSRMRGMSVLR